MRIVKDWAVNALKTFLNYNLLRTIKARNSKFDMTATLGM